MGTPYEPPVRDIAFALDVLGAGAVGDADTMVELVAEFGRFCAEVVAPLNQPGDVAGVRFDPASGAVTTAPGWRDAYAKYVAAGWNAVSFPTDIGGGGFPWLVTTAMQEELNASSVAFALCPMLTQGGVHLLRRYGTPEQRDRYLPLLTSGECTGSMILTEPGAGSDVGALVTRAEPVGDGTFRITGQKIFITYGEHDLTEQIVHVVLARLPDGAPGTKGISCFLIPKVLPDGSRNAVRCIGIEHKMGIHASPTCTMEFDGAVGELIGPPHGGMAAMFTMMNNARLSVGVEGLGVATRAYQGAVAYACERVQGRVAGGAPGSPIIEHPDVRRMVLHMRSHIEAMRLLAYRTALAADLGEQALADLLTPITKAWCTDTGAEVARLATQVVGGMGFIRETGIEQHERDVRVTAIYEGTNGVQAIDLVGRKLCGDDGRAVAALLVDVRATAAELGGRPGQRLGEAADAVEQASAWLRTAWSKHQRDALAGATPYLRLVGTTVGGWLLARQASVARPQAGGDLFLAAKEVTARYFLEQVVPHATGLVAAVTAGATDLDLLPAELF
jgi:alkylation response protein AidB-like acyl-CoA dehydrogenase